MNTKKCCVCKLARPIDQFYKAAKHSDGLQSKCKICHKTYRSEHYLANKQKYIDKAKVRADDFSRWWKEYKKRFKCNRCGESHPACIQFHHADPSIKYKNVANIARDNNKEKLLAEIEKCEVLCANCHFKEHWVD